jgi:hypothetical protein
MVREASLCKAKLSGSQWSAKQGCKNPQQVEGKTIGLDRTAERGLVEDEAVDHDRKREVHAEERCAKECEN